MGRYERKLINEARGNPQILLEQQRFWRIAVFDELLSEVTNLLYTDPSAAHALAVVGPEFAQKVAENDPSDLEARAYAHLGNTLRATQRFGEADDAYDTALELASSPLLRADVFRRRAYLRAFQDKPRDGIGLATQAIEILKTSDELLVDRHPLGLALAARAYCHYNDGQAGAAATDASAAIALIDYRAKPQDYYFTLHNLTFYLLDSMSPAQLDRTLKNLNAAYKRFIEYSQRHIARYKIRWLQAIAQKRFGATRQAERYFLKAYEGLMTLGAASEVAMLALDLANLYIEEGRFADARGVARHAHTFGQKHGLEAQSLASIALLLKEKEHKLTTALLTSIRETITQHAQPYGVV